jgi:hypothetical protein
VPLALTLVFAAAGRRIYFPLRFESVIAAPLMLWVGDSLQRWSRNVRIGLTVGLMVMGLSVTGFRILDALARPPDGCITGALFALQNVSPKTPVVASSYCYLPAESVLGPRVIAFPVEQALHPGWYRPLQAAEEAAVLRRLPASDFVWLGQTGPEMRAIVRRRKIESAVDLDSTTHLLRVLPVTADTLH